MTDARQTCSPRDTGEHRTRRVKPWVRWLVALRMPVILAALVIASTVVTHGQFAGLDNLINVLRQVSFEALIAFGMTLVIVTGGIDLSVGSLVAFTGVVAAVVMRAMADAAPALAIAAGMACGILAGGGIGAASGAIVARFCIPPFIVTLAAMLVARGFAFILCNGQPVYELPEQLRWLGRGFVLESALGRLIPVPVLIMLIVCAAATVLLSRTVFGRGVIAVGSNEEAARLAGIAVRRTKLAVYVITGALAGLAGVLHLGKLMAGDPKVGEMWELNVIAAVVVGGTSLFGGRGSVPDTLVGALIIGVLNNSLNLLHVEHFWQKVVLGGVILAASLVDAGLRRLDLR
ncbi:MAG: ABC transporter permease [Phycisphaerales bacterium]|nr:MAG: ABC transporter permease [Phycisphaerales bacterium]